MVSRDPILLYITPTSEKARERERERERTGKSAGESGARKQESGLAVVIRACRPVICGRAGLLIVTRTPPRFYISAPDQLLHAGRVMRYQPRADSSCNGEKIMERHVNDA